MKDNEKPEMPKKPMIKTQPKIDMPMTAHEQEQPKKLSQQEKAGKPSYIGIWIKNELREGEEQFLELSVSKEGSTSITVSDKNRNPLFKLGDFDVFVSKIKKLKRRAIEVSEL
jgi:phosphoribosyl-dephospho-CoA transferase